VEPQEGRTAVQMSYRTLLNKIGAYGLAGLPSGNAEPFVA
jgi:hypothetical protein